MLENFVEYLQNEDKSLLTIQGYRNDLRLFIRWFEQANAQEFALHLVTPTDLREYRQFLQEVQSRKASTVNRRLAAISALFAWAMETGQVESDPSDKIRGIRMESGGPRYLDKRQQYAILRAIQRDIQIARIRYPKRWVVRLRDGCLTLFLLHTGMRLREALSLKVGDIHLSERKGSVLVRRGKRFKERTIPLNADARYSLQEWLAVRPQTQGDHIWISVEKECEGPLSSRSAERIIQRIGRDAGLDKLTPHMLRHSFGKNLINHGVGLEKVAQLMGHSNLNTTNIYVRPGPEDLEIAVEKIASGE